MSKKRVFSVFLSFIILLIGCNAFAQKSKQMYEILRLIRQEKFDLIMPGALRDNNVDMWMHVVKDGDPDPLDLDFGGHINWSVNDTLGIYIFTDRGGDRIERAIFGGSGDRSIYDIFGTQRNLREFVEERDPRVIAVNMSERLSVADGLSHTAYLRLVRLLGDKYANRLISSENVLTDFRVRRVQREIIAFANACEMQRQIQEEALRRIKPGISTREEIGWWAMDQLIAQGMSSERFNRGHGGPGVMHSEVSDRSETGRADYIFQRGDLISWDWGLKYLNFGTDWKRNAYILREGETRVPAGVQHAWDRALRARKIIRKNIRIGRTAAATLNAVVRAMEDEGYIYTPSADTGSQYRDLMNAIKDKAKSGFSIDCHTVGNTGNSEVASGPAFAPFRSARGHFMIQANNLFSFEFLVNTWIPEWGTRLSINLEDNHIVTENGVEWLYPPNERIILIP
jgi:Xaa-Pro dipeptidase